MEWIAQKGQTPTDLAVQLYGSTELLLVLMLDNELEDATAPVPVGQVIRYSELAAGHPAKAIQSFVWSKGIAVNTAKETMDSISTTSGFTPAFSPAFS